MLFPDFGKLASNAAVNILHIALYKAQNFPFGNRTEKIHLLVRFSLFHGKSIKEVICI